MPTTSQQDIRKTLLSVISEQVPKNQLDASLQSGTVLNETSIRLGARNDVELEQALLTQWHELFRTGYLAWGYNICNPNPPHCHLTERGRLTLERMSRDPGNPMGYLRHLNSITELNPISVSYLEEGLECYVSAFYKSAAVMVGAASESLILELRDLLVAKLKDASETVNRNLTDWKIKTILNALKSFFDSSKKSFGSQLQEEYESYWAAFAQQIRTTRNEVGHPKSVEPITGDIVHAAFLIFPELAKLQNNLAKWVQAYKIKNEETN